MHKLFYNFTPLGMECGANTLRSLLKKRKSHKSRPISYHCNSIVKDQFVRSLVASGGTRLDHVIH